MKIAATALSHVDYLVAVALFLTGPRTESKLVMMGSGPTATETGTSMIMKFDEFR